MLQTSSNYRWAVKATIPARLDLAIVSHEWRTCRQIAKLADLGPDRTWVHLMDRLIAGSIERVKITTRARKPTFVYRQVAWARAGRGAEPT